LTPILAVGQDDRDAGRPPFTPPRSLLHRPLLVEPAGLVAGDVLTSQGKRPVKTAAPRPAGIAPETHFPSVGLEATAKSQALEMVG
jgi:hypothetical protein